ncbi:MAG: hypothetical protein Q8P44_07065 [Dehalococcoidia bacterium]|nr:hypothetical protein [Dehalococcoidia bacterium]
METNGSLTGDGKGELQPTAIIMVEPKRDEKVLAFYKEGVRLKQFAEARVIKTVEDMKSATEDLVLLKGIKKSLVDKWAEYIGPFKEHLELLNNSFKAYIAPLVEADTITREKMKTFDIYIEQERQKAEQLNRDALDVAKRQATANYGEFTVETTPVGVPMALPKTIRTDVGSAGKRDYWDWEVTDIKLIPLEYFTINEKMISAVVRASKGKMIIPGIRMFNNPGLVIRTRKS